MSTSVDTNVLPLPVNLALQGVRAIASAQQNDSGGTGREAKATFAGVLKGTASAAQADSEAMEAVQNGTEQNALLATLQNSTLAVLTGQSLLTQPGKEKQALSVQTEDEQKTAAACVNTGFLMAALPSLPLQMTQAVAATTSAEKSVQGVTPVKETTGAVSNTAGIALLQVKLSVQAATTAVNTAPSVLPALPSTPVVSSSAQVDAAAVLQVQSGSGNVQQTGQQTALSPFATTVLPGQIQQQTYDYANANGSLTQSLVLSGQAQQQTNTADDRMSAPISAGQPAASVLGNAVMQELNIRQISVSGKAGSSTPLKGKAAVSPTASANGEADGSVVAGKSSMATAGYAGTDAQTGLDFMTFAEPNQDKLKATLGDGDEQAVESFVAIVGQQAEKSSLTDAAGQTVAQHLPDPHNVLGQVVEQGNFAKPSYDAGNTEMVIKLKPESLGELTLKVAVDNGVVSASFHSDNPEVRGVLQSSLQQLRQELTDRGLQVDNVGVYAGLTDFSSSGQQEAFRQQQQQQSAALKHTNTSDDFIKAVESTPVLQNTAVDDGVDYRV